MKIEWIKIASLSLLLLVTSEKEAYAALKDSVQKETKTVQAAANDSVGISIYGTGETASFTVRSEALVGKEIKLTAPNGFTVSPTVLSANSKDQKVNVTLNSTKKVTKGRIVLRSGDTRKYVYLKGYGTALPVKKLTAAPAYKDGSDAEFYRAFKPGDKGYTIEFKINTGEPEQAFYPYFVDGKGYGFKAYITSDEVGLFNTYKKGISNPATDGKPGGSGKFYNNDGQAHTYRIAVTPDNRAFIYRDGAPIDSVRIVDYAPQANFASGTGEIVENLLRNPGFEGEYDVNPNTKLVTRVEGWDVVIGDRWNSEQQIQPEEIDNDQDLDNHVFEIKPYKWGSGWSDGILSQTVDVVPNETYTLSALVKGGIAQKAGTLTGKMIIEEVQSSDKRVVTEIASDEWELYSMDYTTSSECHQIRVSFTVGKGTWGNDISAVRVDNAKLTGKACTYSPKFGFVDNTAAVEYLTIDESGAYAPEQPEININIAE